VPRTEWRSDRVEGNKPQATPCCCGKFLFPTFELETMDWSFEPITDDGGVHELDKCSLGVDQDETVAEGNRDERK